MEIKDKLVSELNSRYFPSKGATLVVAVSGGVDSVVLLYILLLLSVRWDWEIIVAHFHHQLRKSADRDAKFVEKLAASLGLKFILGSADVKKIAATNNLTIEEAGRKARYEWLRNIAAKYKAQVIVTGHTADDQVETVVMQWLRGGLVRALAGMQEREEGKIWRPLLHCYKADLQKFAKHYHLQFHEDTSNKNPIYTRNLVRHQILPILKKVNPGLEKVILRNADTWAELETWLDQYAQNLYKKVIFSCRKDEIKFDETKFLGLVGFWQNELFLLAIKDLKGNRQDINKVHLGEMQAIIHSAQAKTWKQLPGKLFLSRGYGKISISCHQPKFANK
ncbi:MAG: tRNA lysidine(34) synthetase TilS [Patescibacteria group bacterium]|jgi:tRNA(Ile)-lysidine synthase